MAATVVILTVVFLVRASTATLRPPCNTKSPLTGTIVTSKVDNEESFEATVTEAQLTKGQTLCFDLMVENNGKVSSGRTVFMFLKSVRHKYEVRSSYLFSVPTMNVNCLCNCADTKDKCKRNSDGMCDEIIYDFGRGDCRKKFADGTGDVNCNSIKRDFEVCCDISVYTKSSQPDYTAILLGHAITTYVFQTGFSDGSGVVIGEVQESEFTSRVPAKQTNIGAIGITELPDEESPLGGKWHFYDIGKGLRTNVLMNAVSEFDIRKLGWYKHDKLTLLDWTALRDSVTLDVIDCPQDEVRWNSSADFFVRNSPNQIVHREIGDAANSFLNAIVKLSADEKAVNAEFYSQSSTTVHATISASDEVVFQYKESALNKFTAELRYDRVRNMKLVLQLLGASGSFLGNAEISNGTYSFTVNVRSVTPIDIERTLFVSSSVTCPSQICLYSGAIRHCETANCVKEPFTEASTKGPELSSTLVTTVIIVVSVLGLAVTGIIVTTVVFCVRNNGCYGFTLKTHPVPISNYLPPDKSCVPKQLPAVPSSSSNSEESYVNPNGRTKHENIGTVYMPMTSTSTSTNRPEAFSGDRQHHDDSPYVGPTESCIYEELVYDNVPHPKNKQLAAQKDRSKPTAEIGDNSQKTTDSGVSLSLDNSQLSEEEDIEDYRGYLRPRPFPPDHSKA